jgi:hypothetical protein
MAMQELANQVGKLSLNMLQLQSDLQTMKVNKDLLPDSTHSAASRHPVSMEEPGKISGDTYECLPSGAKVTTKVLRAARSGECVNLVDFAPVLEPSNITETSLVDGELIFKPKRAVKLMDSFLLWSLAWRGYEEYLVDYDPSLYKQLVEYRIFIQTCAARYLWQAVYAYDVRNRSKHSMTRSLRFNHLDNDIYVTCMDSTTTRPNARSCARCKSIWHVTRDCPFPASHEVETSARQTPSNQTSSNSGNSRQQGRRPSQQICFAWNSGRCHNNMCPRTHNVCQGCGGPDPITRCRTCVQQNYPGSRQPSTSANTFTPHYPNTGSGGNTSNSGYQAQTRSVGQPPQ